MKSLNEAMHNLKENKGNIINWEEMDYDENGNCIDFEGQWFELFFTITRSQEGEIGFMISNDHLMLDKYTEFGFDSFEAAKKKAEEVALEISQGEYYKK